MNKVRKNVIALLLVFTMLYSSAATHIPAVIAEDGTLTISRISRNYTHNTKKETAKPKKIAAKPDAGTSVRKASGIVLDFNGFTSEIDENAAKKGVKIKYGLNSVKLKPNGGSFELKSFSDSAIRYTDVFDGIDYQFAAQDGAVQTKIFFTKTGKTNAFSFDLDKSLFMSHSENGGGLVFSSFGNDIFSLGKPVIRDMSGAEGESTLSVNKDTITVTADEAWVQSLERAYPLELTFDLGEYERYEPQAIESKKPLANSSDYILETSVGYDSISGIMSVSSITVNTALMGPHLPAEFKLTSDSGEITKTGTFPFEITVSELQKDTKYTISVDGVQLEDTFLVYEVKGNLTRGAMIIAYRYGADAAEFSEDNALTSDKKLIAPTSTVFVRNPAESGFIAIGDPTEKELSELVAWLLGQNVNDINEFGLEPINFNTGNFLLEAADISLPDFNSEFSIERTYNSLGEKIKGSMGYGWTFKYDISLHRRTGGAYVMSIGDGRTVWFKYNGSSFIADAGKNYTMKKAGGNYLVTDEVSKSIYQFSDIGLLESITDIYNNTTSFEHDNNFNLKSITTESGYFLRIISDAQTDLITDIILPGHTENNPNKIHYKYESGNLISVTDQEGRITKYGYSTKNDEEHLLESVTVRKDSNSDDSDVYSVFNVYGDPNEYGQLRIVSQTDADGNTAYLDYSEDNEGKYTLVTDNRGIQTKIYYNGDYITFKTINALGTSDETTEYKEFDGRNYKIRETDKDGILTKFEYNDNGLVTKAERMESDGATVHSFAVYNYNDNNLMTYERDFNGNAINYVYDNNNNLISVIYHTGDDPGEYPSKEFKYNNKNQMTNAIDENGNETDYTYEGANLKTVTVYPENNISSTTTYYYSPTMGWLTSVQDANGNITRYEYNKCGEKIATIYESGTAGEADEYRYIYNDSGLVTDIIDEEGYHTHFKYDDNGNQVMAIDPIGVSSNDLSGHSMLTSYDSNNNKTSVIDTQGNITRYTYDSMNRVISQNAEMTSDRGDDLVTSYTYTNNGDIDTVTDPNSNVTKYEYDEILKLPASIKTAFGAANERTTAYTYDNMGNVLSVTYPDGSSERYTYNSRNRISTHTSPLGLTTAYTYDSAGNIIASEDNEGHEYSYTYYRDNRLRSETNPEGGITSYKYDGAGNLIEIEDPTQSKTTYTYDYRNRVLSETNGENETVNYTYDKRGDVISIEDANSSINEMTYSPLRKLESVTRRLDDNTGYTTTFEYDGNENLISQTDALSNVTTYQYDKNNRLIKSIEPINAETSYRYDKNGNTVSVTDAENYTTAYSYNNLNEVTEIVKEVQKEAVLESQPEAVTAPAVFSLTTPTNAVIMQSSPQSTQYAPATRSIPAEYLTTSLAYDNMGRLIQSADSAGHLTTYTYQYNPNGGYTQSQTDKTNDTETRTMTNTYGKTGALLSSTGYDNEIHTYIYDKLDRLKTVTDPESNTVEYKYDQNGNLTEQKNTNGGKYTYIYDKANRLTAQSDPLNVITRYAYDDAGNLTRILEDIASASLQTEMEYDALNRLVTVKNPEESGNANANGTRYTYDALDRLESELSPLNYLKEYAYDHAGNLTQSRVHEGNQAYSENYEYDKLGNNTKIISPRNGVTTVVYNGVNSPLTVKDALGNITSFEYRADGLQTRKTQPNRGVFTYAYDAVDRLINTTTPTGQSQSYTFNNKGDMVKMTDQSGRETNYTYDRMHRVTAVENAKGSTSSFEYDAFGRIQSSSSPLGAQTSYTYDLLDQVKTVQDPAGLITTYNYDGLSNIKSLAESGNGIDTRTTAFTYDNLNNVKTVKNALNQFTQYDYDFQSRLTKETDAKGNFINYTYDSRDNLISQRDKNGGLLSYTYDEESNNLSHTDQSNRSTAYTYDLNNRVTSAVQATATTGYSYDSMGNVSNITDGNGNITSYAYDKENRLTRVQDALGFSTRYDYDINGNLETLINPDETQINYTYDAINELTNKETANDQYVDAVYGYDADGNRVSMHDITNTANGETSYEYDLAGRITAVISENGGTVGYEYDVLGNITKLTYPDGKTAEYSYDRLNRITKIKGFDGKTTEYRYDEVGNLIFVIRPNDTFTSIEYDNNGNVLKLSNVKTSTRKVISDFTYERDASGFITGETARQDGITIPSEYTYDARGQLIGVETGRYEWSQYVTQNFTYEYDNNGNRTREILVENNNTIDNITNTYDAANRLINQTNTAQGTVRVLNYEYDNNGNLIKRGTSNSSYVTYSYDTENRLKAVNTHNNQLLIAALYDGSGERIFTLSRKASSAWVDNVNNGNATNSTTQNGYSDNVWNYEGEVPGAVVDPPDYPPFDPIPLEITDVSYDNGVITAISRGGQGTVKYWFYVLHNGSVTYNSGGWSQSSILSQDVPNGGMIRVYAEDEARTRVTVKSTPTKAGGNPPNPRLSNSERF